VHAFNEAIITAAPGEPQLVGKWSVDAPTQVSALSITWSKPRWLTVLAQGRYVGRRYQDDLNRLPLDEQVLADLMLSRDLGQTWSVHAAVLNAFDEEYLIQNEPADQEIGLPRRFQAGVRLRLGG
jgi:outer membrane cobalamin receptor